MIPDFSGEKFFARVCNLFYRIDFLFSFARHLRRKDCGALNDANAHRLRCAGMPAWTSWNRFERACCSLDSTILNERFYQPSCASRRYCGMCFDCITWRNAA
jgi:hypothetical protein